MLVTRILRPVGSFKMPFSVTFWTFCPFFFNCGDGGDSELCSNGSICIYLPHPPVLLRPPKATPKAFSQLQVLVRPVGPGQVWGFGDAPSLPAGTTHVSLHVPAMAQLKLENTKQPYLASCNCGLALYCSKNSFYLILKPCFLLQNNQYTQNLSAWGAPQ